MTPKKADFTPSLFGEEPAPPKRPRAAQKRYGLYARVALNRPVRREFTYAIPAELEDRVKVGCRVGVHFGPRRHVGVVVALDAATDLAGAKVKEVSALLDPEPVIDEELLGLTEWIARRYACAWGEALAAVLPAPLKREGGRRRVAMIQATAKATPEAVAALEAKQPKQHRLLRTLVEIGERVELRDLVRQLGLSDSPARTLERAELVVIELVEELPDALGGARGHRQRPEVLSEQQAQAVTAVVAGLEARNGKTYLVQGITGSGKTEVYLRAIERALELGKTAILVVPEIALTPQTVGWFRSRFGEVCVLHSRMTDVQRLSEWMRLKSGEVRVVVGARSAIFAPVANLGVIVVDEEHEPSFKQESVPRYHTREVAMERARRSGAVCLLGSATPSLESRARARRGEVERLVLDQRVGGGAPPNVHVVDMRNESEHGSSPLFSRLLVTFLKETLEAKEQAILFLNRRGFVPVLWCQGCEAPVRCAQCDVSLTYHRRIRRLVCHSCCEECTVPEACPRCSRPGLRPLGVGSERVESELRKLLPDVRMARMDSDTMRRREDYDEVLGAFERHELDVLVGTQMIAKGLDFPRVTLVGIVSADQSLHHPDFRARERTFQLVAQVAGRAGRSSLPGRIVLQTMSPDDPAILLAAKGDYEAFARAEESDRELLNYPPCGELLRVLFEDTDEARTKAAALDFERRLAQLQLEFPAITVLPANPAPMSLLRGRFRYHLLAKAPRTGPAFQRLVDRALELATGISRPTIKLDVDPASTS